MIKQKASLKESFISAGQFITNTDERKLEKLTDELKLKFPNWTFEITDVIDSNKPKHSFNYSCRNTTPEESYKVETSISKVLK